MKKIQLPPDVEFHEDIRLFIHRPRGLLNEAVVNRLVAALADLEATQKEPFNRFADTLEADEVHLNFRYIIHVSLYRRQTYMGHPPIKSALLATNETIIHYGKLHRLMTQGSPINFRIFEKREDVADWLGLISPKSNVASDGLAQTCQSMDITSLIVEAVSGAVGGNVAGATMKDKSLGTIGNSIAGIVGGGLGGTILQSVMGSAAAGGGGMDMQSILTNVGGGGVGGAILMIIVGIIKAKMAKG